jgi:hypothetical protein
MMPKTIDVEIQFEDRTKGPGAVAGTARVVAGGLAAGIGKAVREIFKNMDRKQRFDANKSGITITAKVVGDAAAEMKEAAKA